MRDFLVNVGNAEYAVFATTRRTAVASVMLEMLRSGKIRLLDFDAERVSTWTVTEVK